MPHARGHSTVLEPDHLVVVPVPGPPAARFAGQELDVALEATTGWRFVADEFPTIRARVHLAEPAETATFAWVTQAREGRRG